MSIKFSAILSIDAALKAVEQDGDAEDWAKFDAHVIIVSWLKVGDPDPVGSALSSIHSPGSVCQRTRRVREGRSGLGGLLAHQCAIRFNKASEFE